MCICNFKICESGLHPHVLGSKMSLHVIGLVFVALQNLKLDHIAMHCSVQCLMLRWRLQFCACWRSVAAVQWCWEIKLEDERQAAAKAALTLLAAKVNTH